MYVDSRNISMKEHLLIWQKAFEDRGSMFMVHLIQDILDETNAGVDDVQKELDKWLHIKQTTRIYGTRHAEAWSKSDMLKRVVETFQTEFEFA